MLKRYIVILTLCVCVKARAQPVPPPGLKTVTHGVSMSGSGTVAVPLDLRTDCSSNQVLHWNGSAWTCSTPSNGITNGAGNLVIPVSDGTNLIASSISDNGTTVTMTEPLAMGSSKITRLANGSVSSDAAAFGQIATAVNTAVSGTSTDLAVFSGANAVGSFAGSSPSACTTGKAVTAAAISAAGALSYTCTTFSGGGITNSAGADVMPISDGTNLIAPTTSTQILVDGPTLQSFNIPSTSYAYGEVNRWEIGGVVPAYPADLFVGVIRNTASADTTTHSQRSGGLAVETTGSISAGSNGFVAVGIEALASGGTQNLAFEALGGDDRLRGHQTGGDEGEVGSSDQLAPLADLELVPRGKHGRHLVAPQPDVDRPLVGGGGTDGALGLLAVGGNDDGHVRDGAHDGDVLHRLVAAAVLADRDAAVGGDDLHVRLRVGHRLADLLPGPARGEDGEGGEEGDLADRGEPGGGAYHVGLGYPHVEKALRKLLGEDPGFGGTGEVRVQRHDLVVLGAQLCQRFPVSVSSCYHKFGSFSLGI